MTAGWKENYTAVSTAHPKSELGFAANSLICLAGSQEFGLQVSTVFRSGSDTQVVEKCPHEFFFQRGWAVHPNFD